MAGSNNFLQWNPSQANQEDDSAYAADSQRTGGAPDGALFPSATGNKLFYQLSTFIAAFAQALANKNYSLSDSNIGMLEGVLANIVTFADLNTNLTTVNFSPTPVFNATSTNGFDFTLAGNVTSSTLTNTQVGQTITFVIVQGSSAFSFSPPPNINGWIPINTAPNSISVQTFIVRADGTIWPTETEIGLILTRLNSSGIQSTQTLPSRAFSVAYPNTSGGAIIVNVTGNNPGGTGTNGRLGLVCGPSAGSMTEVAADAQNNSAGEMFCSMVVPNGYWYQGNPSGSFGGSCVLTHWVENVLTLG
jgi:hypothetical protein